MKLLTSVLATVAVAEEDKESVFTKKSLGAFMLEGAFFLQIKRVS